MIRIYRTDDGLRVIDSDIKIIKPLTDLEKWKKFLDEMGIKYKEQTSNSFEYEGDPDYSEIIEFNSIELEVDQHQLEQIHRGNGLYIVFDETGKFKYFEPYGE